MMQLDEAAPVPLALFDRECWWKDVPSNALDRAGRSWRLAYLSESYASVKAAIAAGLAVGVLARSAVEDSMRILGPEEGFPSFAGFITHASERPQRRVPGRPGNGESAAVGGGLMQGTGCRLERRWLLTCRFCLSRKLVHSGWFPVTILANKPTPRLSVTGFLYAIWTDPREEKPCPIIR